MNDERGQLEREVARLASERSVLFIRSGGAAGLSLAERARLGVVERSLDERYTALRRVRPARNSARFTRDQPVARGAMPRRDETSARLRAVRPR